MWPLTYLLHLSCLARGHWARVNHLSTPTGQSLTHFTDTSDKGEAAEKRIELFLISILQSVKVARAYLIRE